MGPVRAIGDVIGRKQWLSIYLTSFHFENGILDYTGGEVVQSYACAAGAAVLERAKFLLNMAEFITTIGSTTA